MDDLIRKAADQLNEKIKPNYFTQAIDDTMRYVEQGLLTIQGASKKLGCNVDDAYFTILRAGYKVPIYMDANDVLRIDTNVPYVALLAGMERLNDKLRDAAYPNWFSLELNVMKLQGIDDKERIYSFKNELMDDLVLKCSINEKVEEAEFPELEIFIAKLRKILR